MRAESLASGDALLFTNNLAVPQTVVVKFADGTRETVVWDDDQRWKQWIWVKPTKVVSVEYNGEQAKIKAMVE